ncbi:MAG: hypothetical protein HUK24_05195, partial [Sphaerochaetaceae bacterium]|nr:hypothetical protein [Sphaerochaetaceae bacterium]
MDKNLQMFKAYDLRVKSDLLDQDCLDKLADSICKYYIECVKVKSVVIARDARNFGAKIMEALIRTFISCGIDVFVNTSPISTCHFYYICMCHRDSGGIMITASHNPANYIGCKFVSTNVTPIAFGYGPEGGISKIKEFYRKDEVPSKAEKQGKFFYADLSKEYVEYSMKLANVKEGDFKGLKVLGEFFHGTGASYFAKAMEIAGATFTLSHPIPDTTFPVGDPNPLIETSMAPARELMKKGDFDLGFCFDGDADRIDLMYGDGIQIIPGLNMSIIGSLI